MTTGVVILGSGIGGLSVALALVRAGFKGISVYGRIEAPFCASAAALGLSSTKGMFAAETGLFQDKLTGHELLADLLKTLSPHANDLSPGIPVVEPFASQEEYVYLTGRVFRRQFTAPFGVERESLLCATDAMKELLRPDLPGVFRYPSDFWFDCQRTLCAFRAYLQRYDVTFFDEEISGLRKVSGGIAISLATRLTHTSRLILASGPSLPVHCAALELRMGAWKASPGATLKANFERNNGSDVALLHKTESLVFRGNRVQLGSVKGANPQDIQAAIPQAIGHWEPYLASASLHQLVAKDWDIQFGTRMRIQERHHRPIAEVVKLDGDVLVGIVGGFHKSGWQLAPVVSKQFAKEWFAAH